jgi:hypothetical protein
VAPGPVLRQRFRQLFGRDDVANRDGLRRVEDRAAGRADDCCGEQVRQRDMPGEDGDHDRQRGGGAHQVRHDHQWLGWVSIRQDTRRQPDQRDGCHAREADHPAIVVEWVAATASSGYTAVDRPSTAEPIATVLVPKGWFAQEYG